jgi:hypothetical protein
MIIYSVSPAGVRSWRGKYPLPLFHPVGMSLPDKPAVEEISAALMQEVVAVTNTGVLIHGIDRS